MRLSELIGSEIFDENGVSVGKVHDVRLVQDGPLRGTSAAFTVHGLIAGPHAIGTNLGFDRRKMHGPWMLKTFFTRLHRDNRFIAWERIASIGEKEIHITGSKDDLEPPEML
jgi:uncharacterized protein YrrD